MTPAGAASDVIFINAQMMGKIGSLRVANSRIASLEEPPRAGDRIVDLRGDRLLPGLINAHDHLQLNNLPAVNSTGRYRHVKEWIADIDHRRRTDAEFETHVAMARDARLMVGGVKNLLSGVTTVAHHDPLYPLLCNPRFPIAVVMNYGWSHSLYIESASAVRTAYHNTPGDQPWIIHAAEGLDADAAAEFDCLEWLGCLQPNTVLVHGVALDPGRRRRLRRAQAALIWCPSSNVSLFGKTADVEDVIAGGRLALGTDSRLSGSRDLLEELSLAARLVGRDEALLQPLVTSRSAHILRLADRGTLRAGLRADLMVLPADCQLSSAMRTDVRLVLVNGEARYGDPQYAQAHWPDQRWTHVRVDGRRKVLSQHIADDMERLHAAENGLDLSDQMGKAA